MNNKLFVTFSICLLTICLCIGAIGFIYSNDTDKNIENNNYKSLVFNDNAGNNKIYYCSKDCKYVSSTYNENYVVEKNIINYNKEIGYLIKNRYSFVSEEDLISLYDFNAKKSLDTFNVIKTYSNDLNNYMFIVKKNGYYGVISLENGYSTIIDFKYDFIGKYKNDDNYFLVLDNNTWHILDINGVVVSSSLFEIVAYNQNYYISEQDNKYALYTMESLNLFNNYDEIVLLNGGVVLIKDKLLSVYSFNSNSYVLENIVIINNYEIRDNDTYVTIDTDGLITDINL